MKKKSIKRIMAVFMSIACLCAAFSRPAFAEAPMEEEPALEMQTELEAPSLEVQAQAVEKIPIDKAHFPDANFRAALKEEYGSEVAPALVTNLDVKNRGIVSLAGIEYFTQLSTLKCSGNAIESLDLSSNTTLEYLNCGKNKLTSLDVSQNPYLQVLYCISNPIESLDVSYNPYLRILSCKRNPIHTLDVTGNPSLKELYCIDCQLTELDVSQNPALERLECSKNQLGALDLSANTILYELVCKENSLESLDLSGNPRMYYLDCGSNSLTSLDVTEKYELGILFCEDNQLQELDLTDITDLRELRCEKNQIAVLNLSHLALFDYTCDDFVKVKRPKQRLWVYVHGDDVALNDTIRIWAEDAVGKVSFVSEKEKIASVSEKGVVTPIRVGTAKITVTAAATEKLAKTSVTVIIKVVPAEVKNVTAVNTASGIKLSWKKAAGAKGYAVYRYYRYSWFPEKIKTITDKTKVTFTDKSVQAENGELYRYEVRAFAETGEGWGGRSSIICRLIRPELTKAAGTASGKLSLRWKKNAKASGYEIQYGQKADFSDAKELQIDDPLTVKTVITGLAKGKTWYVRIRSYQVDGSETSYSAWSVRAKTKTASA